MTAYPLRFGLKVRFVAPGIVLIFLLAASVVALFNRHKRLGIVSGLLAAGQDRSEAQKAILDDIDRQSKEARTLKLSRLYRSLFECNNAVVNAKDEQELFVEICRLVVEIGGIKMAWVGKVEGSSSELVPQTAYGVGKHCLDGLRVSIDGNSQMGKVPSAAAFREGRPVWCENFQTNPSTAHWHDRAIQYDWVAVAGIPFKVHGVPRAVLVFYTDDVIAFDQDARDLICKMAENVGFAMESFEEEAARELAEKKIITLRSAIDQSANTVVITDNFGNIEFVNPAFEKSSGYSFQEVVGKNPRILNSGEQPKEFYQQLWATITQRKTWQGQFHNKRKDGSLFWESVVISPVVNSSGNIIHYIAVKEAIAERKALESSLRDARDRAEAANRAKSEFLAVMSHELRTPLNGVLGYADLLADTPLDDNQREFAETIRASGAHLLQVVNDILDFSSIEHGKLHLEVGSVSIPQLLESTCDVIRGVAMDKDLNFQCQIDRDIPEVISGDPLRIRQILLNLLGNAIKFTAAGSVTLSVKCATFQNAPCLDFSVKDTGPGIPEETASLLFKPFTQADSALHRPFEGSGLGLAISQRLAEAMNGKICLSSVPGEGSEFAFHLPLVPACPSENSQPDLPQAGFSSVQNHAPKPAAGGPPVLVVDDDEASSKLAGILLESLGYKVQFAMDGLTAVESFAEGRYLAILMDMQMPVMDGIEATRRIRSMEQDSHVPVIALTANVMSGHRDLCLASGMDTFLTKPFKKAELDAVLRKITKGQGP